jgi:CheY-like chemotaxis protein
LNHSGIKNKTLEKYGNDLSNNDLFFKKLINKELEDDNWKTQTLSNKKLEKIKKLEYKIALIDDQAEYGWTEAFKYLFKNSKIYSFISAKDFEKEKDNWNKFDIVLLDLRLEGDQETNNLLLSGNKLLKKIKTKNPELPVIISTASNKYNNLLDSINYGAHDYWVKETYELGVMFEDNIENSNKLLDSIYKCVLWNNEKRPIIEKLIQLENKIIQHWQQKGVIKRKTFIISQLHNSFSSILGENQEKIRMESIYITAYSILNEIMGDYYITELDSDDLTIQLIKYDNGFDESVLFAKQYRAQQYQYKLENDISALFNIKKNSSYPNIDRFKIPYIGYKNKPNLFNQLKNEFESLKKYRNNSTLIHGNYDDSTDSRTISYKDILKLLSFINRLISIEDI